MKRHSTLQGSSETEGGRKRGRREGEWEEQTEGGMKGKVSNKPVL